MRRSLNMSLQRKIGVFVATGLLIIFALFGVLGWSMLRQGVERMVDERLVVAQLTASFLDTELSEQFEQLGRAAPLAAAAINDRSSLDTMQNLLRHKEPFVAGIFFVDRSGELRWSDPPGLTLPDPDLLTSLGTGDVFGTGHHYASGIRPLGYPPQPIAVLAVPSVGRDGAHAGALAALVDANHWTIRELVTAARQLGHTGHAELVDQHGLVIASTEPHRTLEAGEHPDFYGPLLAKRVAAAGLTEPIGDEDPSERGQRHAMAFAPLGVVPWGLSLGGSEAEIFAEVDRWRWQIVVLGGLALGAALCLVWITTRSVAQSVRALTLASERIGAGDLATPVPDLGDGEVRTLAESLDGMRRHLHDALDALAVEKSRFKDEFLSMVSHELRTPLGHIKGYATTLLLPDAPADDETRQRCLRIIVEASDELEELIDNLLDMSKIGAGAFGIEPRPIRLRPLVRAAVERARLRSNGHRLQVSIPGRLPFVSVDARRIEQVLYNLIDNALKYSPSGGRITVDGEVVGDEVVVSLSDEGIGIPSEELASLFEPFRRGDGARAKRIGGSGLGLAICKGIIEAHRGRIWAESPVPGRAQSTPRGTVIRFTLPVNVGPRRRSNSDAGRAAPEIAPHASLEVH